MKKYDLIVVGTSFSATFFLYKYLQKAPANARILVLERGQFYPYEDRIKNARGLSTDKDYPVINETNAIINKNENKKWIFQVAYGGNSNCWVGCTPRFMPSDFSLQTLYGVGSDWPINYNDLVPYYEEVEDLMNIAGPDQTPFPKNKNYAQPAHQLSTVDSVLQKKYGNLYISQPTARASKRIQGRNACCVSNTCQLCPVNAKFTIENSQLKVYSDKRIELLYGAHVYKLDLENDQVKNVIYFKDGKDHTVSCEVVALGANAIFNAHILLNSGDANLKTGKGIGEQVGLHAVVNLKDFNNLGGGTHVTANGYMLYDGEHRKNAAACIIESSFKPYIRIEKGKYRHLAVFRMVFEDLPNDENYVSLTEDKFIPEVHYKDFSAYTKNGIKFMKQKLPGILSCLPVESISYEKPFDTESHILGTTRMSSKPEDGVIDKHLIHHKYRNLFVLGAGSFTTFSPSNPTLTLSALSLFAADKSF